MPPPRYDILALDLDGTVLRSDGTVSPRTVDALESARRAGLKVVVCTGRGWVECREILVRMGQCDPVVVAGGSIIAEPTSGRTLHRFSMHEEIVRGAVDALLGARHAALILKDPSEAGFDYLVVHGTDRVELDPVTRWWFSAMNVRVRSVALLEHDEHPEHTVRVGACAPASQLGGLAKRLADATAPRAIVHHFPAVVAPGSTSGAGTSDPLHVLELFDAQASKWSGMARLASEWGVPSARICAVGDQINDESMLRGAGLGVAMGNGVEHIKALAQRIAPTNNDDGVAFTIDRVLSGEW